MYTTHSSGSGGVLLACEDLGRNFDHSFPACAFCFVLLVLCGEFGKCVCMGVAAGVESERCCGQGCG